MSSETYKIFSRKYADLRNDALDNYSNVDHYEYGWANMTYPDGYKPQDSDFAPFNRRDKILKLKDYPELCDY